MLSLRYRDDPCDIIREFAIAKKCDEFGYKFASWSAMLQRRVNEPEGMKSVDTGRHARILELEASAQDRRIAGGAVMHLNMDLTHQLRSKLSYYDYACYIWHTNLERLFLILTPAIYVKHAG